jgi:chromosome segregation ATPase
MATAAGKSRWITCGKKEPAGCSQDCSYNHLTHYRQQLSQQLDQIEVNRDRLRQTLTDQTTDSKKYLLIEEIDEWEEDSIRIIQQTAEECRQLVIQHTTEHIHQIGANLMKLTDQMKELRQHNDLNEIDLEELQEKLIKLSEELDKPPNISIQHDSGSLVNKVSVVVSSRKYLNYI